MNKVKPTKQEKHKQYHKHIDLIGNEEENTYRLIRREFV